MRRYRRITMMGEFTHNLHDPLVPSGKMMNHDNARILPGGDRPRAIGLALIAVVAAKFHCLRLQGTIVTHPCTPFDEKENDTRRTGRTLLRTAIQHRLVGHVAIDEFYRIVGPRHERNVADQRPAGEFAFDMRRDAGAVRFLVQDGADTNIGYDLLR